MVVTSLSQMPITYIDVRFFAHATEDLNKAVEAVQHVIPSDYLRNITFSRHNLRGHYGNPITLFETRISDRKIIKAFIEKMPETLTNNKSNVKFDPRQLLGGISVTPNQQPKD